MIWYLVFVTVILIQETGELELTSTITLVLQANRLTNWQEHSSFKKTPWKLKITNLNFHFANSFCFLSESDRFWSLLLHCTERRKLILKDNFALYLKLQKSFKRNSMKVTWAHFSKKDQPKSWKKHPRPS